MLDILSYSGSNWDARQCSVLQDVMIATQRTTTTTHDCDHDCWQPSVSQWMRALEVASLRGRVPDTAWLSRMILNRPDQNTTSMGHVVREYFVEALLHSTEPGALRYMERLLLDWADDEDGTVTASMVRALLQKCVLSSAPGARAEHNVYRMIRATAAPSNSAAAAWQPDAACVYYVTVAFLQEHTPCSLSHVRKADSFVRRCVDTYGLHQNASLSTSPIWTTRRDDAHENNGRVFDALLEAYGAIQFNNTSGDTYSEKQKVLHRADELFRFFLVRHRDRCVTAEEPDHRHLERIVRLWQSHSDDYDHKGSDQCLEYFRLMKNLYDKKVIQSNPDTATIRRLLNQ